MCEFLKPFHTITNLISGSSYPTSNLYFVEIWRIECEAPNPAPDGVSGEGATLRDWDSLTFFFLRADTCIHMHNLCNNNNSFYIYIIHTTIVAFIIFYTHILESLYLYYYNSLLQNYTYKIRDCGTVQSAPISEMACVADVECLVFYPCLLLLYLHGLETHVMLYA